MMFAFWSLAPSWASYLVLGISWFLFVPIDVLRQKFPQLNDFMVHAFRPIMRDGEIQKLAGTTYLLTGVIFVAVLFPRPIVSITLLFLAFADPIASFIGIKYGKDKIFDHKSLQGFMAAYFVCFGCSLIYMLFHNYAPDRSLVFCILAGLVGSLAELVPVFNLDDNLTLPVLSSVGLFILFYLFGFL